MARPPDVAALAESALDALPVPGQVLVVWEAGVIHVELAAVVDDRVGSATARSVERSEFARAAKRATLRARQMRALPAPPLPAAHSTPATATPGLWPPALTDLDGVDVVLGEVVLAVASTTGLRASERRRWAAVTADGTAAPVDDAPRTASGGRTARVTLWPETDGAGIGGAVTDPGGPRAPTVGGPRPTDASLADAGHAATAEVRALLGAGPAPGPLVAAVPLSPARAPDGETPRAVLGPEAVAKVLDGWRPAFGVDVALGARRLGERLAAAPVGLVDDPSAFGVLRRAFDAEGVPRTRVDLVRDGVLCGAVRDSAAAARAADGAASTGHATRPLTLAPLAEHLVLESGDAPDVAALCEAIGDGLYLPALDRDAEGYAAPGAARVHDGRPTGGLAGLRLTVDVAAALAATIGLTTPRRVVGLRGHGPGGPGGALAGALATTDGIRVTHVGPS